MLLKQKISDICKQTVRTLSTFSIERKGSGGWNTSKQLVLGKGAHETNKIISAWLSEFKELEKISSKFDVIDHLKNMNLSLRHFPSRYLDSIMTSDKDFIDAVKSKSKPIRRVTQNLITYDDFILKVKSFNRFKKASIEILELCFDYLSVYEAFLIFEAGDQERFMSWQSRILKNQKSLNYQIDVTNKNELKDEIKRLREHVSNILSKLEVTTEEESEMLSVEQKKVMRNLTTTHFNLHKSWEFAMDEAAFLDEVLVDYEVHYVYADLLDEVYGESFIMGKQWVMSFSSEDLPYVVVAQERFNSINLIALYLEEADEDFTAKAELLGEFPKNEVTSLMMSLEIIIKERGLEFSDSEGPIVLNELINFGYSTKLM